VYNFNERKLGRYFFPELLCLLAAWVKTHSSWSVAISCHISPASDDDIMMMSVEQPTE
jgi:hypothetical protein